MEGGAHTPKNNVLISVVQGRPKRRFSKASRRNHPIKIICFLSIFFAIRSSLSCQKSDALRCIFITSKMLVNPIALPGPPLPPSVCTISSCRFSAVTNTPPSTFFASSISAHQLYPSFHPLHPIFISHHRTSFIFITDSALLSSALAFPDHPESQRPNPTHLDPPPPPILLANCFHSTRTIDTLTTYIVRWLQKRQRWSRVLRPFGTYYFKILPHFLLWLHIPVLVCVIEASFPTFVIKSLHRQK